MTAIVKFLAGGVAAAALAGAAPAAAQYYPGTPGYGYPGGGYGGYGYNQQALVSQCTAAVQQRLGGGYGGYGYSNPYGGGYGGGRVLGVSRIEPRAEGGVTVRGVASSGRYGGYSYGYGGQSSPDLTWKCRTDDRGYVVAVEVNRAQPAYGGYGYDRNSYGYDGNAYGNDYNYDYSQYGYRRY
jgi:hypothetical protein